MSSMKGLYHYFKRDLVLLSPTGPLSKEAPATATSGANKEVLECLKQSEDEKGVKKRKTSVRQYGSKPPSIVIISQRSTH